MEYSMIIVPLDTATMYVVVLMNLNNLLNHMVTYVLVMIVRDCWWLLWVCDFERITYRDRFEQFHFLLYQSEQQLIVDFLWVMHDFPI